MLISIQQFQSRRLKYIRQLEAKAAIFMDRFARNIEDIFKRRRFPKDFVQMPAAVSGERKINCVDQSEARTAIYLFKH